MEKPISEIIIGNLKKYIRIPKRNYEIEIASQAENYPKGFHLQTRKAIDTNELLSHKLGSH